MRNSILLALLVVASASFAAEPTVIPVADFRSIELSHGGHVIVRHGAVPRVTLLKGDLQVTRVRVAGGQRLLIDNAGHRRPRGYKAEIEVVTPHVSAVTVSNGGTVQVLGAFPAQSSIDVTVEQGGTADIRSIPADHVDASVDSGGRIFTTARKTLAASVQSGGVITYWGRADVQESIRDGGVVTRGD